MAQPYEAGELTNLFRSVFTTQQGIAVLDYLDHTYRGCGFRMEIYRNLELALAYRAGQADVVTAIVEGVNQGFVDTTPTQEEVYDAG